MLILSSPRVIDFYNRSGLDPDRMNELLIDLLENVLSKHTTSDPEIIGALREMKTGMSNLLETSKTQLANVSDQFTDKLALMLPKSQNEAARRLHDELARSAKQQEPAMLAHLELKLVSHQQELQKQLQLAREEQISRRVIEDQLHSQLGGFLHTMHSSQIKGQVSEKQLDTLLMNMFSTAEIIKTTGATAAGDFIIRRDGKPDLLVENKTYMRNVDRGEVDKFVRDVRLHGKCCGLFLSQRTGIVGKEDFEINVQDGHVFLYVHAVNMDPGRIRAAVAIIDSLSTRLAAIVETEGNMGVTIPRNVLDNINSQYNVFEKRRSELLAAVKEHSKKMLALLGELELPALTDYLKGSYLVEQSGSSKCSICGLVCVGQRGLAIHMRKHR